MGAWGTTLYANDTTCDVRDTYMDFLQKQLNNQEAYEEILETYHELIGDEEEPLFWYALADTQWRVGRLMPEVKAKALEWIDKKGGLSLWKESKSGSDGWEKTLEKLHVKLETEQPKEKRFHKRVIPFQNPWSMNDIYTYRIHRERGPEEKRTMHGKYILIQKIGESNSIYSPDIIMRVQVYDRVFDNMPTIDDALDTISNYRLLPLSNPHNQIDRYKRRLQGKPDPSFANEPICRYDPVMMSARMDQYYKDLSYPKDELTFICTAEGLPNVQYERTDGDADGYFMWHDFHDQVAWLFSLWQGIEYDVIGDDTFEYPTYEQRLEIKDEIDI